MSDAERVDQVLDRLLDDDPLTAPLVAAMRYGVLGGGKRVRPRLVYATGRLAGASMAELDHAAAAVELIHAYSLIHDDLPAMDDDDLRRGRPTAHVRFGEATGDPRRRMRCRHWHSRSLPTPLSTAEVARCWMRLLAQAAGAAGMVGGQMLDLAGETRALKADEVETMHRHKTGALLRAAVMMGAAAGHLAPVERAALGRFGSDIGLCIPDPRRCTRRNHGNRRFGQAAQAPMPTGASPPTQSVYGIQRACTEAEDARRRACEHLAVFGDRADELLGRWRGYIVRREN